MEENNVNVQTTEMATEVAETAKAVAEAAKQVVPTVKNAAISDRAIATGIGFVGGAAVIAVAKPVYKLVKKGVKAAVSGVKGFFTEKEEPEETAKPQPKQKARKKPAAKSAAENSNQ